MPFAIETHSLTRRFGNIAAVTGLDLRVPERSVYAFLGPNGAGKTTTVRMLLGLIRPDPLPLSFSLALLFTFVGAVDTSRRDVL